jgi:CPA2 family monovalent cation:H+ antiporter-2
MTHDYLNDILLLFSAAVAVVVICLRLKLPPILGYLAIGVMMGPYGLALIANTEHTRDIAEFGVVFLLFTIGLEFSLSQMLRMKNVVLGLGGAQVVVTTAITALTGIYFGMSLEGALILGGVVTMSSTALVVKQLTDQIEMHTRHGKNAIGILLFQDLMVIPFLILASTSASAANPSLLTIASAIGKGALALALILALGRWVLRPLFHGVARFRSTELFTLTALLITLGAAWLTSQLGLSLTLGAFVAGMMLGETEFRHQVEAEVRPFRDVLLGLFFITVGMLLDVRILPQFWGWILLLLAALILVKIVIITVLCRLGGWNDAVALRTGLVLAHGGEFGFAILTLAINGGNIEQHYGQVVLAALLISMALSPLLIRANGRIAAKLLPKAMILSKDAIREQVEGTAHGLSGHVIICGYGRLGQTIARFLEDEGINFVALELDPVLVQHAVKAKEPVTYGDASSLALLKAAGLNRAAAIMICLDTTIPAFKILNQVRRINKEIPIVVRTRDDSELQKLLDAGATEVIPEILEASLMMASHLLFMLKVPATRIFSKIRQVQRGRYELMHQLFPGAANGLMGVGISGAELHAVELPSHAWAVGHQIDHLGLHEHGINIIAMQRHGKRIPHPPENTRLETGDTLILYGAAAALDEVEQKLLLETSPL